MVFARSVSVTGVFSFVVLSTTMALPKLVDPRCLVSIQRWWRFGDLVARTSGLVMHNGRLDVVPVRVQLWCHVVLDDVYLLPGVRYSLLYPPVEGMIPLCAQVVVLPVVGGAWPRVPRSILL